MLLAAPAWATLPGDDEPTLACGGIAPLKVACADGPARMGRSATAALLAEGFVGHVNIDLNGQEDGDAYLHWECDALGAGEVPEAGLNLTTCALIKKHGHLDRDSDVTLFCDAHASLIEEVAPAGPVGKWVCQVTLA